MPQFDILTLNSEIFCLIISLYLLYYNNISNSILLYCEIKKYRTKKLTKDRYILKNTNYFLNKNNFIIKNNYKRQNLYSLGRI